MCTTRKGLLKHVTQIHATPEEDYTIPVPIAGCQTDPQVADGQTASVDSSGVVAEGATGGDESAKSAVAAEAEVHVSAGESIEAEPVTEVSDVGGGTDSITTVYPFADDESASCKLEGDMLVLRFPMNQCLVCPRQNCGRSF